MFVVELGLFCNISWHWTVLLQTVRLLYGIQTERFIFWIRSPITLCIGGLWWTSVYEVEKLVSVCQSRLRKTTNLPRAVHAIISPLTAPTGFQMSYSLSHTSLFCQHLHYKMSSTTSLLFLHVLLKYCWCSQLLSLVLLLCCWPLIRPLISNQINNSIITYWEKPWL